MEPARAGDEWPVGRSVKRFSQRKAIIGDDPAQRGQHVVVPTAFLGRRALWFAQAAALGYNQVGPPPTAASAGSTRR